MKGIPQEKKPESDESQYQLLTPVIYPIDIESEEDYQTLVAQKLSNQVKNFKEAA
ncbi:MAG: hypothetical protein JSR33_13880 [Proteobacteria bacterium]|nr:hypothetical protein [Pseudomonadota bacterium]